MDRDAVAKKRKHMTTAEKTCQLEQTNAALYHWMQQVDTAKVACEESEKRAAKAAYEIRRMHSKNNKEMDRLNEQLLERLKPLQLKELAAVANPKRQASASKNSLQRSYFHAFVAYVSCCHFGIDGCVQRQRGVYKM